MAKLGASGFDLINKVCTIVNYSWPGGEVVTLRSAKPTRTGSIPVLASSPYQREIIFAGVVELVDTRDLKSLAILLACGFNSRSRHKNSTKGLFTLLIVGSPKGCPPISHYHYHRR